MEQTVEKYIKDYPFLQYINEDKSHYKHAKDAGYDDPDDLFLIGDSGGFLLNIQPGDRFVNTHLFTEAADFYRKNKCYTFFKQDSVPHRRFRKREEYRRKHGYTAPCLMRNGVVQDIRITGGMYNYLNYTMIEQLDTKSAKATDKASTGRKIYDFPKFIDAQFWTWHIMEFVQRNGFHLIIDKTRRGGFSYIMAADSANDLNLNARKVGIHVAADKKYLTATGGLTDFTINNLRFYETKTPFVRGILSTNSENFRLGFKLPNGTVSPKSWNSALFSVSAMNNPDCAIGKDAMKVKVEELSTMDNFDDFMSVTEPAMRTGSYVTGNLFCWGTATSGNMQVFETNFYSPQSFGFMPFENVWDKDSRNECCGYFKPYAWGLQGQIGDQYAMDEDGNSNLLFSSESLMSWEETLRTDNRFKFYVDGTVIEDPNDKRRVIFKTNARIEAEGGKLNQDFYEWIQGVPRKGHEHPHGCVRLWFNPIKVQYTDKDGNQVMGTPPGIYSISYDPVGVNKENRAITNKHSHNSIKVWMEPCQYNNFKPALAAAYYGRPERLEEADWICYLLARLYNCVGTTAVEINRGETVSNFTKWKALRYLMKDPVEIWDTSLKGKVAGTYGVNMGDGTKKLEGLRLLKEMLYTVIGKDELGHDVYFFQTIYDYQSILELKKWNNLGNFDRVSEMIMRALRWRLFDVQAAKELAHRKKIETNKDNIWTRNWF